MIVYWTRRTKTGRVVYDRKPHDMKARDLFRMAWGVRPLDGDDVAAAAGAIVLLSAAIGHAVHGAGSGIEVISEPRLILNLLEALARSPIATRLQQKDPLRATEMGVIIEGWRAFLAIQEIEESVPDVPL